MTDPDAGRGDESAVEPTGLHLSPAAQRYVAELRETWPPNDALAAKHGVAADTGRFQPNTMTTDSDTHDAQLLETNPTRRRFLQATGAAAAAVAVGSTGAAAEELAFDSELVPDPWIDATVTIDDHDRAEMSSALEYVDDADELTTLASAGATIAEREEDDEPHNPITLRADRIDAADYHAFPRGETYEDADGDEQDLDAIDAEHWSTDESASAGTISVEDVDAPSGGPGLAVSSDGNDGTLTATFDDFELADGELRKHIQLVLSVEALDAGATVTIRPVGESGTDPAVTIDPDADETADDVVATSTVTGAVYQQQIGELVEDVETISALEIEIADADAAVEFYALNLERSSRWDFGTREYLDEDDELATETVREPVGEFSVMGINTLGDVFGSARIRALDVAVEFRASGLPSEQLDHRVTDAERHAWPRMFESVVNHELPTAYDLDYADLALRDEQGHPEDRHRSVELDTTADETATLADIDDDELDMVDRTDQYSGDIGDEIELSTTVSEGETIVVYYELLVDEDEEDEMVAAAGVGGVATSGDGGIFSGVRGMLLGLGAAVASFVAMTRSRLFG